ncbi:MAG TPA: type I methionyl aminopeptidase [Thermoanaerobaculia bacterium]
MHLKTKSEIAHMRQAGLAVWRAHQAAAPLVQPGVTTAEIDAEVEAALAAAGAAPLFKGVPGKVPFPAATCISVNDEVVHGIPGPRRLAAGDVVSLDIGARIAGWCGDAAVTYPVGPPEALDAERALLLAVTEEALRIALSLLGVKRRWRQVASEMGSFVRAFGFGIVESLTGHGIGRTLWEPPEVPNSWTGDRNDFELRPGLVIAVEPMVNAGTKEVRLLPDGWTIVTRDHRPSAHFEHTVAITRDGPQILTAGPDGEGWALGPSRAAELLMPRAGAALK